MTPTARRGAMLLVLLGATAVGLREVVSSSTFQDPMGAEALQTLQNILPALAAQGYRFETVSALVGRRTGSR